MAEQLDEGLHRGASIVGVGGDQLSPVDETEFGLN